MLSRPYTWQTHGPFCSLWNCICLMTHKDQFSSTEFWENITNLAKVPLTSKKSKIHNLSCQFSMNLRCLYCLTIIGCNFVLMICCIKLWYHTMDLGLPFHSCTFDDITMTSSSFRGNHIFLIIPCFWKKWNHPSNSNFASSLSMIISKNIMLAFEDYCFCFPVIGLFMN